MEIILKAELLEKHPFLQTVPPSGGYADSRRRLHDLCFRDHSLEELAAKLPEAVERLRLSDSIRQTAAISALRYISANWNVALRYSPQKVSSTECGRFLKAAKEILECLK